MAAPARPKERRPLADSGKHRLLLAREGSGSGSATRRLCHAPVSVTVPSRPLSSGTVEPMASRPVRRADHTPSSSPDHDDRGRIWIGPDKPDPAPAGPLSTGAGGVGIHAAPTRSRLMSALWERGVPFTSL